MAIKFEKIQVGMILYDRHKQRAGNTTLRSLGEWTVRIITVDPVTRTAEARWNDNTPSRWRARDLEKLSTWSMHDSDVVVVKGLMGIVLSCRRLTKAERIQADRAKAVSP